MSKVWFVTKQNLKYEKLYEFLLFIKMNQDKPEENIESNFNKQFPDNDFRNLRNLYNIGLADYSKKNSRSRLTLTTLGEESVISLDAFKKKSIDWEILYKEPEKRKFDDIRVKGLLYVYKYIKEYGQIKKEDLYSCGIDKLTYEEFKESIQNSEKNSKIKSVLHEESRIWNLIKNNDYYFIADDNIAKCIDPVQLIVDGPPGTGKSYEVKKRYTQNTTNYERVTFYADYEYHNFVGSILPVLNNGNISYEFVPGPFTKILNDALSNPLEPYYLIIEELTRGNASGIFGDVFQLLDREKGGWSEYPVSNSNIFSSLSENNKSLLISKLKKEAIALPPNLSIICTINSSDQNVYPLDTAFKRRFIYEIISTEITDKEQLKELKYVVKIGKEDYVWNELYTSLNKFFLKEMELKEDKQIGPYFIKEEDNDIMVSKLALYLWNDIHSIHKTASVKLFADEIFTLSKLNNLMNDESEEVKSIFSKQFLEFWDENHAQN